MRGDGKDNAQTAKKLVIKALTSTKYPAQDHALATIIKSKDKVKVVKAQFKEVLEDLKISETVWKILDKLFDYDNETALRRSLFSIAEDDDIKDKKLAMKNSVGQYLMYMQSLVADVEMFKFKGQKKKKKKDPEHADENGNEDEIVAKGSSEKFSTEDLNIISKVFKTFEIKMEEKMDPKELAEMMEKAADKAVKKATEPLQAELAKSKSINALTVTQKSYFDGLDEAGQDGFLALAPEARNEVIEIAKSADEEIVIDGHIIKKSSLKDPVAFAFMKSQAAKDIAKDGVISDLQKSTEQLQFTDIVKSKYAHVLGTLEEKVKTYTEIQKMINKEPMLAIWGQKEIAMENLLKTQGHQENPEPTTLVKKSKDDTKAHLQSLYPKTA